jgi:hypothetical protein
VILFATTIFLNAALLFWLEPLFAKLVLPLLGGAPAVWNTCLVFYQVALLAGYLWAHLGPRLGSALHAGVHLALSALAFLVLPIAVPAMLLPPSFDAPRAWLLGVLVVAIGLPFFLIAANGPLLQRWFVSSRARGSEDPYFLYAASNLGSAAALLLFPLVLERFISVPTQTRAWQVAYVGNVVLVVACAFLALRRRPAGPSSPVRTEPATTPSVTRRAWWVALSAVPSSLMIGVTTYISNEIAPIPLVWIIPLALYLATLVIAFANVPELNNTVRAVFAEPFALRTTLATAGTVAVAVALGALAFVLGGSRAAVVVAHLLLFFVAALICHVQLAESRPPARKLTEFYFWMGVGGAAGGIFNTLVGPRLFTSVLEYPLALAAVIMLLPSPRGRVLRVSWADMVLPAVVGLVAVLLPVVFRPDPSSSVNPRLWLALPAIACLAFSGRPLRFGLGIAAVILASAAYPSEIGSVEHAERNFYGVHRVLRDDNRGFRWLTHGTTVHGGQRLADRGRPTPLTYYHPTGPLGDVFSAFTPAPAGGRVAVIGLGAGSMASYSKPGQGWTFYEIDPAVIEIARNPRYFTFLQESHGVRVVPGDARLTLGADRAARYDMIVLDAFGSDAVPVHLLTREVMQLYLSRLAPRGLLVMHLSNRFLDLTPVASALSSDAGLHALRRIDLQEDLDAGKYRSHWVVFARDSASLVPLASKEGWEPLPATTMRVWTDNYSSVLTLFRQRVPAS